MKTRVLIAVIAFLSILSMAPDFYLPIAANCPAVWMERIIEVQHLSPPIPGDRAASFIWVPSAQLTDSKMFSIETGQEPGYLVQSSDVGGGIWFSLGENVCSLIGSPYQARFVLWFEGGCQAEIAHEWIVGGPYWYCLFFKGEAGW